ncbi:hypothetical protein ACLOJK_024279 [Asimina triloba]
MKSAQSHATLTPRSGSAPFVQPRMSGMTLARTHRVQCARQASHRCVASCSLTVPLDAPHQ